MTHSEHAHQSPIGYVVVAYHRPEELLRLFTALANERGDLPASLQCVVVNVDADPQIAEIALRVGAKAINATGNPGYGAAVNLGVQSLETEIVVFSNDDVVGGGSVLTRLAQLVRGGEADVAVPRVTDADGSTVPTCQAIPDFGQFILEWLLLPQYPIGLLRGRLHVEKWRRPARKELIVAASAILVATRRDLLLRFPLPEEYFMYFEESEWFWKLRDAGLRTIYCPDVAIQHSGGSGLVTTFKSQLQARNAVRLFRRCRGRTAAAAAYPLVVAWQARLLLVDAIRAALRPRARPVARARLAGFSASLRAWREVR